MFLRSTRELVFSSLKLGHQIICCFKNMYYNERIHKKLHSWWLS